MGNNDPNRAFELHVQTKDTTSNAYDYFWCINKNCDISLWDENQQKTLGNIKSIKSKTVSGTTNSTSGIIGTGLTVTDGYYCIGCKLNIVSRAIPFISSDGGWNIVVLDTDWTLKKNVAVSGTLYYM